MPITASDIAARLAAAGVSAEVVIAREDGSRLVAGPTDRTHPDVDPDAGGIEYAIYSVEGAIEGQDWHPTIEAFVAFAAAWASR